MQSDGSTADSAELASALIESSTQYSIIATDADGVILLWNRGACLLYGYASSEILGQPVASLHSEEDVAAGLPQTILDTARREGNWAGTVERRRKDGSGFVARVVATPRYDDDELSGFLVISSDITEEVQRLHDVEDAQVFASSLLEAAPDATLFVDGDGRIRLANAETERLFGYDRDELVGSSIELLLPERYHGRLPPTGFLAEPRVRPMGAGLELWGRRRDGGEFPVEIGLSPTTACSPPRSSATSRSASRSRSSCRERTTPWKRRTGPRTASWRG